MKLYKCLLTGDDLFTDAKPPGYIKKIDGFWCVKGKSVTRSNAIDESAFGFNASAEEASEGTEDGAVSGIDVEIDGNFVKNEVGIASKKVFMSMIKDYVKDLKEKIPEADLKDWQDRMVAAAKTASGMFSKVEYFYSTSSGHENGMPIFMCWEIKDGDGEQDHPYYYFFEGGIKEEKL